MLRSCRSVIYVVPSRLVRANHPLCRSRHPMHRVEYAVDLGSESADCYRILGFPDRLSRVDRQRDTNHLPEAELRYFDSSKFGVCDRGRLHRRGSVREGRGKGPTMRTRSSDQSQSCDVHRPNRTPGHFVLHGEVYWFESASHQGWLGRLNELVANRWDYGRHHGTATIQLSIPAERPKRDRLDLAWPGRASSFHSVQRRGSSEQRATRRCQLSPSCAGCRVPGRGSLEGVDTDPCSGLGRSSWTEHHHLGRYPWFFCRETRATRLRKALETLIPRQRSRIEGSSQEP